MTDGAAAPGYQWVAGTDPDLLALQFPPVAVFSAAGSGDGMRALFSARGFVPAADLRVDELPVANGCALLARDAHHAELVIHVGDQVGAARIPVPHDDTAWAARVLGEREVLVLVCSSAIEDGVLDAAALQRDLAAGGVLAARVPAGDTAS